MSVLYLNLQNNLKLGSWNKNRFNIDLPISFLDNNFTNMPSIYRRVGGWTRINFEFGAGAE
jgi:hypothetical protein